MTERRARRLLWATAAAATAGAALAVGWAVETPPDDAGRGAAGESVVAPAPARRGDVPPLSAFAPAWAVDLRRPLVDAPPPPAPVISAPVPVAPPPPAVHVWGTIIEAGHSMAMVAGPGGKPLFLRVGDALGGAKVVAITSDSVTFDSAGSSVVAPVEKPPPAPASPLTLPGLPAALGTPATVPPPKFPDPEDP